MIRKLTALSLCLLFWTALVYLLLYGLDSINFDPVRFVFSPEPGARHHGKPVLDPIALSVWLAVLSTYGIGCAWLTNRVFPLSRRWQILLLIAIIWTSVGYVAAVHPTFLPTALKPRAWNAYYSLAARIAPALDTIYLHWGLHRLKYHILAGQAILTLVICGLVVLSNNRKYISS